MQSFLRLAVLGLSATVLAFPAEAPPGWQSVLDEILAKAQELTRPAPAPAPSPPARESPLRLEVSRFIRHFQDEGRAGFRASLARLKRYRPMIERIFREEGVPRRLLWVGLVESGYDPSARSHKGARGIWQFIPETAARFQLIRKGRDFRSHPERSTRAAARYLRTLFEQFGDWNLALAAYNAGEGRVASAVRRAGTNDFWMLSREGLLPRETRQYVPAVLAARFAAGESRIPEPDTRAAADRVHGSTEKAGNSSGLTPAVVFAPMTFSD